jgi:Tol biopolymer transport system component
VDEDGEGGLWVTNGLDEPRQLTKPCFEDPDVSPYNELWEWSPVGAQLVVARRSIDGDSLVLIDAATGDRTDLGGAAGDVTALGWSPDGTRIAYGTPRGSVYSVGVGGGDHSLLASSLGSVSGGETVSAIRWSPHGERIAVAAYVPGPRPATLYLMNADGSDLELLTEGVVIEHILGSPNVAWSPEGTRIAYATFTGGREELQIWNGSPDGSTPILVYGSGPAPGKSIGLSGGPVWSPDGATIAFRYSPTYEEKVWLVANADGTGDVHEIDELRPLSWRGGWYFCECYG